MNLDELRDFLLKLGAPAASAADMAQQLDKRARQLSQERNQSYEQALAGLVALLQQGWAGQAATTAPATGAIQPFEVLASRPIGSYRIFDLREDTLRSPRTGREGAVYVLETRDWVNVVVETPDQQLLLIEQFRFGTREISLEVPGGVLDEGESPVAAARRELLEETGYDAAEYLLLGAVRPNPAFLNNRAYTVLARAARKVSEPEFDPFEDIANHLVAPHAIPRLIAEQKINHALVVVAFHWYDLYRAGRLPSLNASSAPAT